MFSGKKVTHLFLDVDGVLNNTMCDGWFDNFNLSNLNRLCGLLHGPRIVLSSDWRRTPANIARVRLELNHIGLDIFDTTPVLTDVRQRHEEIAQWLSLNSHELCIILDDMESKFVDPELPDVFFFRTNHQFGLTEDNVDFIIRFINEQVN